MSADGMIYSATSSDVGDIEFMERYMERFEDDDHGYLAWLQQHPIGYVANAERRLSANHLILHKVSCATISGRPANGQHWTRDYVKLCSVNRTELAAWANQAVGGQLKPCGLCAP
jgi:hypothetical protein